jgi:hypothetical protein
MSASNAFESDILALIFQNANIANIGDATGVRGSTAVGNLYVALHTADPGEAGNQSTSEAAYTGYARVSVVRSAAGWTISGTNPTTVANTANVDFPASTGGVPTITHFSVGYEASGATKMIASGVLTSSQVINVGATPNRFAAGALTITVD